MNCKEKIAELLINKVDLPTESIVKLIEVPANKTMGDFALPCFSFAKTLRKAPPLIAEEIAKSIEKPEFLEKIVQTGAYINFFLDRKTFAKDILSQDISTYLRSNIGGEKVIVLDYSSPNIAKPFHVGHLRSTVIGQALKNIYKSLGFKCVSINHLGDWGTQFGKMIVAYKMWGNKQDIIERGTTALMELYVRFHKEAKENPNAGLDDLARAWFVKMQESDEEAISLWKWINDISLIEYERIYDRLSVSFDHYTGESFYNDKMDAIVDELKEKNLLTKSDGAMIVDLGEDRPPCLILRADGGTLYATRDITACKYRYDTFSFYKSLYVTALDQNLHFEQFFKVIEMMGYDFYDKLIHVPFGLVSMEEGKLSTRAGQVVFMEDLLNEAVKKTKTIMIERSDENVSEDEIDETAEIVGIGAVIFNDLYNGRIKDVVFSWDKMLNFNGETGPYVQYTYTRAKSILQKATDIGVKVGENPDFSALTSDSAFYLIKSINDTIGKLIDASEKNEPSIISRHLIDICQGFNKLYNEEPILKASEEKREALLLLVRFVAEITKELLSIIGIKVPNKM